MKPIKLLFATFFSLFSLSIHPNDKPNIVLILIDDLGQGRQLRLKLYLAYHLDECLMRIKKKK